MSSELGDIVSEVTVKYGDKAALVETSERDVCLWAPR